MKKKLAFLIFILLGINQVFAQNLTAKEISNQAAKKETAAESVQFIKEQIPKVSTPSEKRALYIFLASLQEQMALYNDAQTSYATAAGIAAADADGMPKKSNEQLVLDAVRCALSSGDFSTADSYLNSAVRNSKNQTIQAYIKLYTQWSALCRAESVEDLQEPIVLLQAYTKVSSMQIIHPAIFLTLWYVTGEKSYASEITEKFPKSVEASIVKGDVQLLPTPFWFFVPKAGEIEQGVGTFSNADSLDAEETDSKSQKNGENISSKSENAKNSKITKWQLGLFKTESNAKLLTDEVIKKGFKAYITSEKRSSGTVYYLVLVDEDETGNIADRLRSSGYDCYALE